MYRTDTDTDLPVLLYVRTVLRTVRYLQYVKMSEILLSNDDYLNDCFCAFFGLQRAWVWVGDHHVDTSAAQDFTV